MSAAPEAPEVSAANPRALLTVIVLCFGGLGVAITQTVVIPIQSELPQLLHTSAANTSWVVTATLLGAAVSMPIAGRLGDILGKQRVAVGSVTLLALGSLVCALSNSLTPVLVGRVLQGFAIGFIPVGIALMREVTPPKLTSTAIAAMSATLGVGGAIGLPLAAWIANTWNWHALFWFSVVVSVVIVLTTFFLVPHVHDANGGRLDVVGAVGLAVGLVAVLVGISKANEWGWTDGRTIGLIAGGLVVLVLWGWFELRRSNPLCDLRVTAQGPVLMTNLAAFMVGFGLMATSIVAPQLLEMPTATGYGLGQSILAAGLWMAPSGLMMMIFAPVSSGLIRGVGAKWTLTAGLIVMAGGYVVALFLMDAPWQLSVAACVIMAGVGVGYAAMPTLILAAVPMTEAGSAVGINSLMRSLGTTVSAAVMTAALTGSTMNFNGLEIPTKAAFRSCFAIGIGSAVVGAILAALIPLVRRPGSATPVAATASEAAVG